MSLAVATRYKTFIAAVSWEVTGVGIRIKLRVNILPCLFRFQQVNQLWGQNWFT